MVVSPSYSPVPGGPMHNNPLHREITVKCGCCHTDCIFIFKSRIT
jgi:hypothetical protein